MITDILKDHSVHMGTLGVTLTLAAKWIFDNISPILGLIAAFGGIIVVALSIAEKIKKNRLLDLEIKREREEIKRLIN
jgi:hypothetical protein